MSVKHDCTDLGLWLPALFYRELYTGRPGTVEGSSVRELR